MKGIVDVILAGHQPNYWPYPGLIGKIMRADKFLFVSNVQLEKKSWQMRNRIRTKEGWMYISVPVLVKGKYKQKICETKISNNIDWKSKTRRMIEIHYAKAPYYKEYRDFLDDLYIREWVELNDINIYIINYILKELSVDTEVLYDLNYRFEGEKTALLVDFCNKLNCSVYMSNWGSSAYVQIPEFNRAGIDHMYIDYKAVKYRQRYVGFEPGLSILDMLMNCGKEKTRDLLMDDANFRFSEINRNIEG